MALKKIKKNRIFIFSWNITNICNYKCVYCNMDEKSKNKISDENIILDFLNNIKNKFKIELVGGEPTLHPRLKHIIDNLTINNKCISIDLVTNYTQSYEFYDNICTHKVRLLISNHVDYIQKMPRICISANYTALVINTNYNITTDVIKKIKYVSNTMPIEFNILYNTKKFIKEDINKSLYSLLYLDTRRFIHNNKYVTIKDIIDNNNLIYYKNTICNTQPIIISVDCDIYHMCSCDKIYNYTQPLDNIFYCNKTVCNCSLSWVI